MACACPFVRMTAGTIIGWQIFVHISSLLLPASWIWYSRFFPLLIGTAEGAAIVDRPGDRLKLREK